MKQRMDLFGIGSNLIVIIIPYIMLIVILSSIFPKFFKFTVDTNLIRVIGLILFILGLVFLIWTLRTFIKNLDPKKLITCGPYSWCRNPIYASWIIFIVPGISLSTDSWLILTASVVMYIFFKLNIHKEEQDLTAIFGVEYLTYKNTVNEIFPLPYKHKLKLLK